MEANKKGENSQVAEGLNLLAQGLRNILCKEFSQAVSQLADATKILAQEYGDMGVECADAYYTYGRALLELHRSECSVLGDAIPNDKKDDEDDEEEEEGDEEDEEKEGDNEEAEADNNNEDDGQKSEDLSGDEDGDDKSKEKKNEDSIGATKADSKSEQKVDDAKNNDGKEIGKTDGEKDEKEEVNGGEVKDGEENEEEVSNLQLAWEVFELAKLIYSKQDGADAALKLANAHFKLADVGLESELFEEAVADYEACLKLQQLHLPADSRLIAETHYQLGLAHSLRPACKPAIDHFLACIQVLQGRIERMEKVVAGEVEGEEGEDSFYTPRERAANEVSELKELIKDIYLKIEEVKDEEKEAPQVSEQLLTHLSPTKNPQPTPKTSPPTQTASAAVDNQCLVASPQKSTDKVNNITHLVRKKRKNEEVGNGDVEKKKSKVEDTVSEK